MKISLNKPPICASASSIKKPKKSVTSKTQVSRTKRLTPLPQVIVNKAVIYEKLSRQSLITKPVAQVLKNRSVTLTSFSRPKTAPVAKTRAKNVVDLPRTPESTDHTKRIFWNKRSMVSGLIIVVFEGVLGDHYKESLWSKDEAKIKLRNGVARGLVNLSKHLNIALLLTYSKTKNQEILAFIKHKKLHVDAVYSRKTNGFSFKQNYSQISEDFDLTEDQTFAILSSLTKIVSYGEDLYEEHTSSHKRYPVLYAPVENSFTNLICLFVPHSRLNYKLQFHDICAQLLKRIRGDDSPLFEETKVPLDLLDKCPVIVPRAQLIDRVDRFYVLINSHR